jgi:hypothetical protein
MKLFQAFADKLGCVITHHDQFSVSIQVLLRCFIEMDKMGNDLLSPSQVVATL